MCVALPRGRRELSWALPDGVAAAQSGLRQEESRCGRTGQHYCSRLTLGPALVAHTGSFRCRYRNRTSRQIAVYVYVTDSQQPFVRGLGGPDVLYMTMGQPLLIPCRVTHPSLNVSLAKCRARLLTRAHVLALPHPAFQLTSIQPLSSSHETRQCDKGSVMFHTRHLSGACHLLCLEGFLHLRLDIRKEQATEMFSRDTSPSDILTIPAARRHSNSKRPAHSRRGKLLP
ncbi:hypothetical protein CRUP_017123 [Coryphaenoides rupestris]|nr:hypothetical protein CRUP_017123 [Coryphaenoides rupestris]